MTSRHYDVVVLGRSLGALSAAALLARRDFRVLLLGQGDRPASYRFEQHVLKRRAFTMLFGSSPVWHRILHELAQTQTFKRRSRPLDPMFAVVAGDYRIEVPPDVELFAREVDREFPEVRQVVDEMYAAFAQANAAADDAFEHDLVWPPGTLWERLATGRVANGLPLTDAADSEAVLGKFPPGHPYREIATLPATFATDLATGGSLSPFALARLHGSWTRGVGALEGGEDELEEFFIERIKTHGGVCRLEQKATALSVRRGNVVGVLEDGEEDLTGAGAVIASMSGERLADLAGGEGITKAAQRQWPRLTVSGGRFVVSAVVERAGLPDPLPTESFLLAADKDHANPRQPTVHLQRLDLDRLEGGTDRALLVAETIVPKRGALTLFEAREAVLSVLCGRFSYLEDHLVVVDSPHDGLPLYDYSSSERREIDRIHLGDSSPSAESMPWIWSVEPPGYLGIGGEPVRGPIPGTYLVGKTALPALGQEGELLAAWSAARLITGRDRQRQKMRREMWRKIETG